MNQEEDQDETRGNKRGERRRRNQEEDQDETRGNKRRKEEEGEIKRKTKMKENVARGNRMK